MKNRNKQPGAGMPATSFYKFLFKMALAGLLMLVSPVALFTQTNFPEIDYQIDQGNFTHAQELIRQRIAAGDLSREEVWDLQLQSAILDRIRLDFNRDEAYVRETLKSYYPDLSDEQLAAWEATNELESRIIDGEKRYFRNAVWNLFRINDEAGARKRSVDGDGPGDLDRFLAEYLPVAVEGAQEKPGATGLSKRIGITYTLRVKPNAVPAGEMVRAWLPFPRNDRQRLTGIQLHETSEPHFILSPLSYPHTSIYMEKRAVADEWTEFSYHASYTAFDEWHDLLHIASVPYDTTSDVFRTYTAERATHIRFSPEIKKLAKQITGNATDPVEKAWRLYRWIGENIPWASALEYSTMPDIPGYCLANQSGDCGMKALLFITLCRASGIPAKWQSGWFLYPGNINLHDWTELYFEGTGWVPVDPDFNIQEIPSDPAASRFFFGGADAYRLIVNDDYSGDFFPAKIHPRSETVDFQRGEVEWRGGNLYFDQWRYDMEVEYLTGKE